MTGCENISMRCDDGDNASRGQDEPRPARLLDGVPRLFLDFGRVPINERVLSHAATDDALVEFLGFG